MQVLWVQDSKVGHINQVKSLLDSMILDIEFEVHVVRLDQEISASLLTSFNQDQLILLIGAGSKTYSKILALKKTLSRNFKTFAIAILKPSYKLKKFDLICAPAHDFNFFKPASNVLTFQGSICETSLLETQTNTGIIAIGGSSNHYKLDEKTLINEIVYILDIHPKYKFKIFNSRRTPVSLSQALKGAVIGLDNVIFIDVEDYKSKDFKPTLQTADIKFVTPDSSNLVFESLSSKGKTYLMQIEDPQYKRIFGSKKIRNVMNNLVSNKNVGTVSTFKKNGGVKVIQIQSPKEGLEPLAEAEKLSFKILNRIKNQL